MTEYLDVRYKSHRISVLITANSVQNGAHVDKSPAHVKIRVKVRVRCMDIDREKLSW